MSVTPAPTTEWAGPKRFLPPTDPRVQPDGGRRYDGITCAIAPGYRPLLLDLWVPASPTPPPLVVWIHGGAWMLGDRRYLPETLRPNQLFEELVAAGLAVATIDYRHALEAQFPAQLHDAKAAIRHSARMLTNWGLRPRIGVWGESAGGHLASLVGLTGLAARSRGRHRRASPIQCGRLSSSTGMASRISHYSRSKVGGLRSQPSCRRRCSRHQGNCWLADLIYICSLQPAQSPMSHQALRPFLLVHGTADAGGAVRA